MSRLLSWVKAPFLLLCIFLTEMLSGCSDKYGNTLTAFKSLNQSLENGVLSMQISTETLTKTLEEKTKDSATARRARIWYANALHIQNLTTNFDNYLDSLKSELEKATAYLTNDGNKVFREDDIKAVEYLFETKRQGSELERKMYIYRDSLLAVHDHLDSAFRSSMYSSRYFDGNSNSDQGHIRDLFKDIPMIAAVAMLTKFQHSIKSIENRMVQFCYYKTPNYDDFFTSYSAIIAQSSKIVQAGETIEITAGIGAFSLEGNPKVMVYDKAIPLQSDGVSVYKFKAPNAPGKHIVPVRIIYTNPETGWEDTINKNVEYTVADMQ